MQYHIKTCNNKLARTLQFDRILLSRLHKWRGKFIPYICPVVLLSDHWVIQAKFIS